MASLAKCFVMLYLVCLSLSPLSAHAQDVSIQFSVESLGQKEIRWSFSSNDPRPLLYLVTVKEGPRLPRNCDDGRVLFAVRDIFSYQESRVKLNRSASMVQLCALTLQGAVIHRSIVGVGLH